MDVEEDINSDFDEKNENHPAIINLKKLLEENKISQDVYRSLSFKFQKLSFAFLQCCNIEQALHRKAHDYNKELKAQKLTISNSANLQAEHRGQLNFLRQEVANMQAQLDYTQEQIEITHKNTEKKTYEAEKLADKLKSTLEEADSKIDPIKRSIINEINDLQKAIETQKKEISALAVQHENYQKRYEEMKSRLAEIDKKRQAANKTMAEIGSNPIKIKQQANAVQSAQQSYLTDEKNTNSLIVDLESKITKYSNYIGERTAEVNEFESNIEALLTEVVELKNQFNNLNNKISVMKEHKHGYFYELNHVQKLIGEENFTQSQLIQKREDIIKSLRQGENECQKFEDAITKTTQQRLTLESQLKTIISDSKEEQVYKSRYEQQLKQVNADLEKVLKTILVNEKANDELIAALKEVTIDIQKKQITYDLLVKKEKDLAAQVSEAALIRDRKAREMASMRKRTSDIKHFAQERHLDLLDLQRKQEQIADKLSEFAALYETVKNDRNRHVSAIQGSAQLIVELKEKIRIIENEGDVLVKEFNRACTSVQLQKSQLEASYGRRDKTRETLKHAENVYYECEEKIDYQLAETERMNRILTGLEDMIESQQHRYAIGTADLMDRRRLLIDKQDALCILNEQFNRNEEVLKQGEKYLRERDEEIHVLEIQLRDFERNIEVMSRKVPEIRKLDEEIKELQLQISREQKDTMELTKKMENPDEHGRMRRYTGKDYTNKELDGKIFSYEARVSEKKKQLWEVQILYKELKEKNAELSNRIKDTKKKSNKVSRRAGKFRANAMDINRKKKAALSELAVMHAQQLDLAETAAAVKEEIINSSRRANKGEDFDEFAGKMVRMHERDIKSRQDSARRHRYSSSDDDDDEPKGREKFDAYPTADGLSRPYGAFPVFQPQKPSGNLRHYRKDKPRDVEI